MGFMVGSTGYYYDYATEPPEPSAKQPLRPVETGALFLSCPFCSSKVEWPVTLTERNGDLKPRSYSPAYFDCPSCGKIVVVCQVSEDQREVVVRLIHGDSTLEELRRFLDSLTDTSKEAFDRIAYAVLGGLGKDGLEKLYRQIRKKDSQIEFENALREVLDRYEMRFCSSCDRPVKRTFTFCIHCGKALY